MFLQNSGRMCSPHLHSVLERKSPLSGTIYRGHNGRQVPEFYVYGYKTVQYFPISLSQLFMASCLFGEENISPDFLLTSFSEYIAADDREVLDACLSDAFDPDDKDTLEFLSTFMCFRMPRKDNIQKNNP